MEDSHTNLPTKVPVCMLPLRVSTSKTLLFKHLSSISNGNKNICVPKIICCDELEVKAALPNYNLLNTRY